MNGRMKQRIISGLLFLIVAAKLMAVPMAGAISLAHPGHPPRSTRTTDMLMPMTEDVVIKDDIKLRRMRLTTPRPKGTILLLHGFPETLHAWEKIAPALAADYEVHAFDWPGYGLSSRPSPDRFSYAPRDYARILDGYIESADIDTAQLTIYATDIGALPALLLALEKPAIARSIVVGDFAPFDRPHLMYESLRSLKAPGTADQVRAALNRNRSEILANTFTRGLTAAARFAVSAGYSQDLARGWDHGGMSSADAFYHYYSHFTRDQNFFEANLARLQTPVRMIWGERDLYIDPAMGAELANRAGIELTLLPGVGHYPHLQSPERVIEEIRAAAGGGDQAAGPGDPE